jgi:alpha-glucosidase
MTGKDENGWIWWKHGVIYHIYPRSFQDSNNDGIGDIQGIIRRLGYLAELGIDAIWLSPIFESPMVDFGYDVSDYGKIDPLFGTLDDFRELLEKSHQLGIRVILDMVLNHTSDQHPWFIESASSLSNSKRNWYVWRSGPMATKPNNWRSAIGGSAWKFDHRTGEYYLHSFFEEMPDLNWRDPELPGVIFNEMRFWLDLGVDGFRLDVINLIAKDKQFRDNPVLYGLPWLQKQVFTRNRKRSLTIVKKIRSLLDQYENRISIGEIFVQPPGDAKNVARYLRNGDDGIHLAFDFSLIFSRWSASSYYECIRNWYDSLPERGWPCNVQSNHDLFRSINRIPWRTHREEKAKVAAFLLLTLHGTPFIYYGEEIGMHNTPIRKGRINDPLGKKYWPLFSGRDPARTPMQWDPGTNGGFTAGKPWLPLNRDVKSRNVRAQEADPHSLLNTYRTLIRLRKESPVLQNGSWNPVSYGHNGILSYFRTTADGRVLVVLNFTGRNKIFSIPEHTYGEVLCSTHRGPGEYNYFQAMKFSPFEATIWIVRE